MSWWKRAYDNGIDGPGVAICSACPQKQHKYLLVWILGMGGHFELSVYVGSGVGCIVTR